MCVDECLSELVTRISYIALIYNRIIIIKSTRTVARDIRRNEFQAMIEIDNRKLEAIRDVAAAILSLTSKIDNLVKKNESE